jgi:mono/diheme cytochrome c family protein
MNKNKHLLLWSSIGVLALLIIAWSDENIFREWRRIQLKASTPSGPVDVRLRQISVASLKVNDRCVTCHLGMSPGEQDVMGSPVVAAHPPIPHDPGKFGCTVCHGGQGRATEKADAHGHVPHWTEPMLPKEYSYSGCGSCHTHLKVQNQSMLKTGLALLERYDCLACHRIDNRGGTLRTDGASGMSGPDLSRAGAAGFDSNWYEKHLAKSKAAAAGAWKSNFGRIEDSDRRVIEEYLASRVGASALVEAKSLFNTLGCRGCHKVGGVGGDDGPDLTLTGQKDPGLMNFSHIEGEHTLANWHRQHLRAPSKVVPGSAMPDFALSDKQIDLLTLYLMSLRRSSFPEAYWPKDRVRAERLGEREFASDGATLFGTFCAACHGQTGEGRRYPNITVFPAVGNPDFLAAASDEFIAASIHHGRPGRRMPAWGAKDGGLRTEEIASIISHLRKAAGVEAPPADAKPARWVKGDVNVGERLFAVNCASCHGKKGEGIDAPALSNKALQASGTDTYLVQTITRGRRNTVMRAFGQSSSVNPALSESDIESIVTYIRTWEKP